MVEENNNRKLVELVGACCLPYIEVEYMLTKDEREALIKVVCAKPDIRNLAIALCLHTGLRPSEAVVLKRQDVNFEDGTLSITRAEIKCRIPEVGKYAVTTLECRSEYSRTLVLSDVAEQILEAAIKANPRSEYIFAERDGKMRVTWDMLARRLRDDCNAAEITRKHPAALRMSYAMELMRDGADLETVLTQLGLPYETEEQK